MKFGSLFAGIRGFDLALVRAGATSSFAVEIEPQCNSIGLRHFPDEEQHTDVSNFTVRSTGRRPDIICAGWPCQGNSVAGKRGGMADERSGLWGEVRRVLTEFTPTWFFGENVPGILSVNRGRDWLTVLRDLAELGYGAAYRVLDAQWFGVAQRRRRVFIVGHLGDWRRAAEVLFEPDSLPWNPTPSRQAGARTAACLTRGTDSSGRGGYAGRRREDDWNIVSPLDTKPYADHEAKESRLVVTHSLRAEGADASEDGTGRGTPIIPILEVNGGTTRGQGPNGVGIGEDGDPMFTLQAGKQHAIAFDTTQITSPISRANPQPGDPCHTLAKGQHAPAIAFQCHGTNVGEMGTLRAGNGNETGGVPFTIQSVNSCIRAHHANETDLARSLDPHGGFATNQGGTVVGEKKSGPVMRVRRLTPRECERLQGFPDDWTRFGHDGKEITDSPRYRMIGNSVAVPCVEWIARRIVETLSLDS